MSNVFTCPHGHSWGHEPANRLPSLPAAGDATPAGPGTVSCPICGTGVSAEAGTVGPVATTGREDRTTENNPDARRGFVAALAFSLRTSTPETATPTGPAAQQGSCPDERLNDFALLRPHASGGLGHVSLARDERLGREVAVKQIRPDLAYDANARRRFLAEATITGQLEHPNIVPVYALGTDQQGRPYYAMKLVKGRTLGEAVAEHYRSATPPRLAFNDLLRRFVAVCQAVAFAHSRGVIHRDLKPANIMLGEFGETLVLDWGLAKRIDLGPERAAGSHPSARGDGGGGDGTAPASPAATAAGKALGTPAYMPPEQAGGHAGRVGPAADVYGLGAVLYQILTGRPPYADAPTAGVGQPADVLRKVAAGPPQRPSSVRPGVPAALEAVCLKAMGRRPGDRYGGADELAREVERWLADEPVAAFSDPPAARAARWVRRHRGLALGLTGALVVAVVALSVGSVVIRRQRDAEAAARLAAEQSGSVAEKEKLEAQRQRGLVEGQRLIAEQQRGVAEAQWKRAELELADGLVLQGDLLGLAGRWFEAAGRYEDAYQRFRRLGAATYRADYGLWHATRHAPPPLISMAPADGAAHLYAVALAPDGRTALVGGTDQVLEVWDVAQGGLIHRLPSRHPRVSAVAVSADGRVALSAGNDGIIRRWDLRLGQLTSAIEARSGVMDLTLSPDGRRAVSVYRGGGLSVWDTDDGTEIRNMHWEDERGRQAYAVDLSDDGRTVVTGHTDGTIKVWEVDSGRLAHSFAAHPLGVTDLALLPDGRTALSCSFDRTLKLWDTANGRLLRTFHGHTGMVRSLAVSPDGRTALSGAEDKTVRWWDLHGGSGGEQATFGGHTGLIWSVAFTPGADKAVSVAEDGTLKVWALRGRGAMRPLGRPDRFGGLGQAVWLHGGRTVLCAGATAPAALWDVETGRPLRTFNAPVPDAAGDEAKAGAKLTLGTAVAPDGRTALTSYDDGTLKWWDLETDQVTRTVAAHAGRAIGLAISPDGTRALTTSTDATMKLWDVGGGGLVRSFGRRVPQGPVILSSPVFSLDGRRALTGGVDGGVTLWDLDSGGQLRTLPGHPRSPAEAVAFSADGRTALSGGYDKTLRVWDLDTGRALHTLPGHDGDVHSVSLSPDGRVALSAANDYTVRLWDLSAGRELRTIRAPGWRGNGALFAPDGGSAVAIAIDGTMQVMDFSYPQACREWAPRLQRARAALQSNPTDPAALADLGRWYAFRGACDWAAALLLRARAGGVDVSPLLLARCHWELGNAPAAAGEFRKALDRKEAPEPYLRLCLGAAEQAATQPATAPARAPADRSGR